MTTIFPLRKPEPFVTSRSNSNRLIKITVCLFYMQTLNKKQKNEMFKVDTSFICTHVNDNFITYLETLKYSDGKHIHIGRGKNSIINIFKLASLLCMDYTGGSTRTRIA